MPAGTITLTNNSTAVIGSGTAFPTELKANDFLVAVVGGTTYTLGVKSVESATALTLATAYGGPTTGGLAWTPIPNGTLVGITAQIAADTARAIRGLNYDKQNWQQVYSSSGNITVTLPDGSTYTGPSWNSISSELNGKADKTSLGTAASKNIGTNTGEVVTVASEQLGYRVNLPAVGYSDIGYKGFYGYATLPVDSVAKLSQVLVSNSQWSLGYSFGVYRSVTGSPDTSAFLLSAADGAGFTRNWYFYLNGDAVGPGGKLYSEKNTIRAADGTLKAASPVIKLFTDGHAETNAESEGCTVTRKGTGEYLIEGCIGMNADAAWGGIDGGFDIPKDRNRQPLIWLDYDVNPDGSVLVKTYHRTHPDAPAFARNMIGIKNDDGTFDETVKSGEPIDIPADQFVSVRVEMPEHSIYNQKRVAEQQAVEAVWKEELRKAEEEYLQQEADQK